MKIGKENVKRYSVYRFYDKDGIADEYVITFLKALKNVSSCLQVVVCGRIGHGDLERLEAVSDQVVYQSQQEDMTALFLKTVKNVGSEKLKTYDEVILCEDAFYGPVYPLTGMLGTMADRDVDFWSVLDAGMPSFLVLRKSVFEKADLPGDGIQDESVCSTLPEYLKKQGFVFGEYISLEAFAGYTDDPFRDFPRYLVEEKKCPIIRKDIFRGDYGDVLAVSSGDSARDVLDYMDRELEYDVTLIWKNLLRTCNMADIKKRMQLNYVLSTRFPKKRKNTIKKIALTMHIYYEDQAEMCRAYAENMPEGTDVFITVPTEQKKNNVEQIFQNFPYKTEIRVIGNRGRDVGAFLTAVKDVIFNYDLVCKMHDKKVTQVTPMSLGASWAYKCFENMLKNKTYVENIIATFEEEPLLGMLEPPIPNHGPYYPITGKGEWGENCPLTQEWAQKLGIHVDITEEKEPAASLGAMFWFRPQALKTIFDYDWEYEDYPEEPIDDDATLLHAIERLYPFCSQWEGYYPAWVMADSFARIELDNWEFLNREFVKAEMKKFGDDLSFRELVGEVSKLSPEGIKVGE